jgi:hypothetical protein
MQDVETSSRVAVRGGLVQVGEERPDGVPGPYDGGLRPIVVQQSGD